MSRAVITVVCAVVSILTSTVGASLAADNASPLATQILRDADAGNAEAQNKAGILFLNGVGVERDPAVALGWFQKAASQGCAAAKFNLAIEYVRGVIVPPDMDHALVLLRESASAGLADARQELGMLCGDQGEPDAPSTRVVALYEAAEHQDATAMFELAESFKTGKCRTVSRSWRHYWLLKAASGHSTKAMMALAQEASEAHAPEEEVRWLEEAASEGAVDAKYQLGKKYLDGIGHPRDIERGLQLTLEAAMEGLPAAEDDVGLPREKALREQVEATYRAAFGHSGPAELELARKWRELQDDEIADLWLIRAAMDNESAAWADLAERVASSQFATARKTLAAMETSLRLASLSARAGDPRAMRTLGSLCEGPEAGTWLRMAAEQGSPEAQQALAAKLARVDPVTAEAWAILGSTVGGPQGEKLRDELAASLDAPDLALAKRRAREIGSLLPADTADAPDLAFTSDLVRRQPVADLGLDFDLRDGQMILQKCQAQIYNPEANSCLDADVGLDVLVAIAPRNDKPVCKAAQCAGERVQKAITAGRIYTVALQDARRSIEIDVVAAEQRCDIQQQCLWSGSAADLVKRAANLLWEGRQIAGKEQMRSRTAQSLATPSSKNERLCWLLPAASDAPHQAMGARSGPPIPASFLKDNELPFQLGEHVVPSNFSARGFALREGNGWTGEWKKGDDQACVIVVVSRGVVTRAQRTIRLPSSEAERHPLLYETRSAMERIFGTPTKTGLEPPSQYRRREWAIWKVAADPNHVEYLYDIAKGFLTIAVEAE